MTSLGQWLKSCVPIYEEWNKVDRECLFRIKVNGDGEVVRFLIVDSWYDRLVPIIEAVRFIRSSVRISPIPEIVQKAGDHLENLVIEFGYNGITFGIFVFGLATYLADKAISVGKMTYESYGYGEGPFGRVPFGGGTVAHEYPVTT